MKSQELQQIITELLQLKLRPLISDEKSLNSSSCIEIYVTIFEALTEVVQEAHLPISNEGMNYLAQQYYDGIRINDVHELDPTIFDKRVSVGDMPTKELALLAAILSGTDFILPVVEEIKRRS
jgi:hypothetical protein